jgi:hypothetical protein
MQVKVTSALRVARLLEFAAFSADIALPSLAANRGAVVLPY